MKQVSNTQTAIPNSDSRGHSHFFFISTIPATDGSNITITYLTGSTCIDNSALWYFINYGLHHIKFFLALPAMITPWHTFLFVHKFTFSCLAGVRHQVKVMFLNAAPYQLNWINIQVINEWDNNVHILTRFGCFNDGIKVRFEHFLHQIFISLELWNLIWRYSASVAWTRWKI